jgi:acyl-CoA reductase-like NAD-dependent aldehyde dehydrogenase
MGTVIDEAPPRPEARAVAAARGAKLLAGNERRGGAPAHADRPCPEMDVVKTETFGPASPVIRFRDLDQRRFQRHRLRAILVGAPST